MMTSISSRGIIYLLTISVLLYISSCSKQDTARYSVEEQLIEHPDWTKSANIYEVNIRQYTPEGTFNAFREHLPRLQEMGVDILWLMPIHPIGEKNRKGELGSYYSIRDYRAVNPNFGTMNDFKALVQEVHERDMKLILDWVPNHTAWDHPWVTEHPEYYMKDSLGNITYEADWTDIAQLNYENRELWDDMIDRMKFWITEADIDGYRVDHAGHDIPLDFWKKAVPEVDREKEGLFWLAEWNTPEMHPWFDATYAWEYFHLTTAIAKGEEPVSKIDELMVNENRKFPDHAYRLRFTTNHDENSWNGSDPELFGDNFENFAVLAATIDGMPLLYSGQETGLDKRLEFFKKDTISWDDYEYQEFYTTLLELNHRHEALWNGQYGGEYRQIHVSDEDTVFAYKQARGDREVLVFLNLSNADYDFDTGSISGTYSNVFTGETVELPGDPLTVAPHAFVVLEK